MSLSSSWFAIRNPLTPRRALVVKLASFLLPLVIWSVVSYVPFIWHPQIRITDPGDAERTQVGSFTSREDFAKENASLQETRPRYAVTDQTLEKLRAEGVPKDVLAQLAPLNGKRPADSDVFQEELSRVVAPEHLQRSREQILRGCRVAYLLTSAAFDVLKDKKIPAGVLDGLKQLRNRPFMTREAFLEAIGPIVTAGTAASTPAEDQGSTLEETILEAGRVKDRGMAGEPANPDWLPPPHKVVLAFYNGFTTPPPSPDSPWLAKRLWDSCQIVFWGFLLSVLVGLPLGLLCGTFDLSSKLFEPFIDFIRYMPAPAFGVVCVGALGLHDAPKIAIIWIGTFFQMVLVVANTTRLFDYALLEAAQTLGARKRSLLTKVILPGILPNLYNDMRILLGWAWTYLIVAELIGASSGISEYLFREGKYQHYDNVYAGIISIGLIGLACDQILAFLAGFLFPWQPTSDGGKLLALLQWPFVQGWRQLIRLYQKPEAVAVVAGPATGLTAQGPHESKGP